jgi:hypothetical protein
VIKYVVGLLLGIVLGVVAAGALLYFNPLAARNPLSPLSVSNNRILSLGYSVVPTDSIVLTNNGESRVQPHPENVRELWEAPVRLTEVLVTVLTDSRNNPAGIGIKYSSDSEDTRLINGEVLVNSAWHIHPCSWSRPRTTGTSCARSSSRPTGVRRITGKASGMAT